MNIDALGIIALIIGAFSVGLSIWCNIRKIKSDNEIIKKLNEEED